MNPNKTIEQAADFKTAIDVLIKHTSQEATYLQNKNRIIMAMQEYAQQFEAKWVSQKEEIIKIIVQAQYSAMELRSDLYKESWDSEKISLINKVVNKLQSILNSPSPPTEVKKGEESNG